MRTSGLRTSNNYRTSHGRRVSSTRMEGRLVEEHVGEGHIVSET